jgi:hypothetical protein
MRVRNVVIRSTKEIKFERNMSHSASSPMDDDDDNDFVVPPPKRAKTVPSPAPTSEQQLPSVSNLFLEIIDRRVNGYLALKDDLDKIFADCAMMSSAEYEWEQRQRYCLQAVKEIGSGERAALLAAFLNTEVDNISITKRNSSDPHLWCLHVKAVARYSRITFASKRATDAWIANGQKGRSTGQYQASHVMLGFFSKRPKELDGKQAFASHLCHESNCCNPHHLEWASPRLNIQRQECNMIKRCKGHDHARDCIF